MGLVIPLQKEFRPVLPTVVGNVDYRRFEEDLLRMDQILDLGGVERLFVELSLKQWLARGGRRVPSAKEQARHQKKSAQALRCVVLMQLLGEDLRGMSRRLAECPFFQWFCGVDRLEHVRVPSKSQLGRYLHGAGMHEAHMFCYGNATDRTTFPQTLWGYTKAIITATTIPGPSVRQPSDTLSE